MPSEQITPPSSVTDRLVKRFLGPTSLDLGERTRTRVFLHLIPWLFFLYILAYLDRVNVSVAQLGMEKPPAEGGLGFTKAVFGFGGGIFFLGYWLLEIPSTLSVLRWGARWVFVRILVLWGLACLLVGLVGLPWTNRVCSWLPPLDAFLPAGLLAYVPHLPGDAAVTQFYFFRFLLGFFEGGFFPSVILYLSLWSRPRDRARAIALFMAAIPVSSLIGSPVSGLMLHLDWLGLPGWRWVFILQGLAPIVAGFLTLFLLPDRPAKAAWLPADEKAWLTGELEREHTLKKIHGHAGWLGQAGIVLLMTGYYFCLNVTSYGLGIFMAKIIQSQSGLDATKASILAGAPYGLALAGMLVNGWHSDRTQERIGHVAVPLVCLSLGIFLAAVSDGWGVVPVLAMIFLVGPFLYAHLPAFWPIPSIFLGSAAAASAIGFINMVGNLGGFVGPVIVGSAKTVPEALFLLAPFPLASVALILLVGYLRRDRLAASRE